MYTNTCVYFRIEMYHEFSQLDASIFDQSMIISILEANGKIGWVYMYPNKFSMIGQIMHH